VPQARLKALALQYADLERRLGEVDRARAIYAYGAQFCNPRTDPDFWKVWHEFEVNHGNPDTFREMMRVRRSVVAQFAYSTNFAANYMAGGAKDAKDAKDAGTAVAGMVRGGSIQFGDAAPRALNSMQALEASQRAQPLAPSAPQGPTAGPAPPPGAANPEEIELGEDEGEGEGAGAEGPELAVEQQQVPAAVFGAALEAAAKQAAKQRV
jgi:pre-mRNA-splicing factor SYF1